MNQRRTALITGASGAIGAACAYRLARQGWDLLLHYRTERDETLTKNCTDAGARVGWWQADLSEDDWTDSLRDQLKDSGEVTGIVHAAGNTGEGLIARVSDDQIDRTLAIHVRAAAIIVRECSRHLLRARFGRIVLIGSTVGLSGNAGQSIYAAAKMGQIGLVRAWTREMARRGITSNVVAPGWIETDMTVDILNRNRDALENEIPAARIGQPDDVAAAVAFLMTEEAGYISGQTLPVNGGLWMV
ncbi:MAG: SDR family oxidoreductase [Candidatus Dadabacteria bacterium]|nr:MAG: SDR family oxidoreductase [Candidatus Dadabacteria bacterium]